MSRPWHAGWRPDPSLDSGYANRAVYAPGGCDGGRGIVTDGMVWLGYGMPLPGEPFALARHAVEAYERARALALPDEVARSVA